MNKEWFVFKNTHHLGPFSVEELEKFYHAADINDQTLMWKEGAEKWLPLSKITTFQFLFLKESLPQMPNALIPPRPPVELLDDELPPPIPLDAIIDPKGEIHLKIELEEKKSRLSKIFFGLGGPIFAIVIGWYALTQRDAGIQLKIKGLMPFYVEKLETLATKKTQTFEVALALSLDSLTLWGSTNYSGEIQVAIQLKSIPKRVLGTEEVAVTVKGEFKDHLGKFTRMTINQGSKFLPGEYTVHITAVRTHFFKSFNKTYTYDDTTLIYAGTPRDFAKRIEDYWAKITEELLKPYQDKLERMQTFDSLLNTTSQYYLMELEKAKMGYDISLFEAKFIKEISPLLQSLVVKASELAKDSKVIEEERTKQVVATYQDQVFLGKQIGEMASDMITKTSSLKRLSDKEKSELRAEFDKRALNIKQQIELNLKKLEEKISSLTN